MNKLFLFLSFFLFSFQILEAKKILTFAPLPLEDIKTIYNEFSPMVRYLEKELDVKIKIDYNDSYDSILKKFMNGKIDIAYLGPLPYISLESKYSDTIPLVNFKNHKGEVSYTCSFVSFLSNTKKITDISNEKIALTQPLSTCGYLFVNDILRASNINIEKTKYKYLGRHDKVALSVIRDEFSFGGLKSEIARKYYHLGLEELALSKPIPNFILIGNAKTLEKKILLDIKNSMLSLDKSDLSLWHEDLKYGVKETNLNDYKNLRELLKSTKIPPKGNFNGK